MSDLFGFVAFIPILPLLGAILNLFFNRNPRMSGIIACATVGLAFVLAIMTFVRLTGLPEAERSVNVPVYT